MTTITVASAKLTVVFAEGKLPAIDPQNPEFEIHLGRRPGSPPRSTPRRPASWRPGPAVPCCRAS